MKENQQPDPFLEPGEALLGLRSGGCSKHVTSRMVPTLPLSIDRVLLVVDSQNPHIHQAFSSSNMVLTRSIGEARETQRVGSLSPVPPDDPHSHQAFAQQFPSLGKTAKPGDLGPILYLFTSSRAEILQPDGTSQIFFEK